MEGLPFRFAGCVQYSRNVTKRLTPLGPIGQNCNHPASVYHQSDQVEQRVKRHHVKAHEHGDDLNAHILSFSSDSVLETVLTNDS